MILAFAFAKASCAAVIRTARDVVADFGVAAVSSQSEGLLQLSKKRTNNGERDCHNLLAKQMQMSLPIPKTFLDTKDGSLKIPFLRIRDWMKFLATHNRLHLLCGLVKPDAKRQSDIWQAWWANFELQFPSHPVFERARSGEISLQRTIPIVVHGDEGRGKKKSAFLILNWHSMLGRGIETGLAKNKSRAYLKMLPNYVGHSYTTRWLLSALPKRDYTGKNSFAFEILMQTLADELLQMSRDGINHQGEQYHVYCLGMVGDWPWLAKSGGLERTFMNIPKHAGEPNRQACKGVCHLCLAGQPGWDYEQINTRHPAWLDSVLTQPPFDESRNTFSIVPHIPGQLPMFWRFDIFHTVHLGVARNYLGSMLALLSQLEAGGSVDSRFELLSASYLEWCSSNHRQAHCQRITKEHLNWVSTNHYPTAGWHKGDLSTSLLLYCEARYHAEKWEDETLALAGEAAEALNGFLHLLYNGGAWLAPDEAEKAAELGLRFLRRYSKLSFLAFSQGKKLWLVMPKHHSLHHILLELLDGSKRGPVINGLCWSVQQDEDFIGRGSRLSRHVSAARCSERTVDRYLMSAYSKFVEAGYLVVAKG